MTRVEYNSYTRGPLLLCITGHVLQLGDHHVESDYGSPLTST